MRSIQLALGIGLLGIAANCGGVSSSTTGPSTSDSDGGTVGTSDGGTIPQTGPSDLPCAVDTILAQHCRSCHQNPPLSGARMPLMTWSDLQAPAKSDPSKKVYELLGTRIHDNVKPMPPPPNMRLSATDTTTLDNYIAAGAPKSTEMCSTTQNPDGGVVDPLNCTPDVHMKSTMQWTMPTASTDEYVCYGYDVTTPDPKHIIAFAPHVDNAKIVHHILVFQADAAEPTTPAKCSSGGKAGWRIVYVWAPGGKNMYLPKEAGFPLTPGAATHYVVQVHYNNANALAGEVDSTGVDACTSTPRQYEADVVAFGTQSFTIPANNLPYDRTCTVQVPSQLAGKTMFTAMPHMHQAGTQLDTRLTPVGGGPDVDMGKITNWDFQSQFWLPISVVPKTNDTITTHCQWRNTTGADITFGEKTSNEMCYSFTMYYPRIPAPWHWATPAYLSKCN
jgi:hypothetical protein